MSYPKEAGLEPALGDEAWRALDARLKGRPFLYSEGLSSPLGMPTRAAPWLREEAAQLVAVFDRFFRAIVDAEGALASDPARIIGEPYESFARLERDRPPLPLSRLDCVLHEGKLRVIELNPVGVCTLHLRAVAYQARALRRTNDPALAALAEELGAFSAKKTASIRRFVDATLAEPPARPTIGVVVLPGMHRGTKLVWAHELRDADMDVVIGTPSELRFDDGSPTLRGKRVDALWLDWLIYLGYQQVRYEQTRFESRIGNFSTSGASAAQLLEQLGLIAAIIDRKVTLVTPIRAYRALSKALLAWVERKELALSDADRAFVREHIAETWDATRRAEMKPADALLRREGLVLKPCRFGGSHGVVIGRECDAAEWERQLALVWSDPEWILQAFIEPNCDDDGARLSYGVYNYDGALGGLLVRSSPLTIVGARNSGVIAAL